MRPMASRTAATAALKMLEEPPIGTFIVLVTTHLTSCCRRFGAAAKRSAFRPSARLGSSGPWPRSKAASVRNFSRSRVLFDGDLRRALNLLQSAQCGLEEIQLLFGDAGSDVVAADLLHQLSVSDMPMAIDRVKVLVGKGNDSIGAQRAVAEISNQLWALSALHAEPKASASQLGVSAPAMAKLKDAGHDRRSSSQPLDAADDQQLVDGQLWLDEA